MRCTVRRGCAWCILLVCTATLPSGVCWGQERTAGNETELAGYDALIKDSARDHWSFRPVRRSAVPAVADSGWVRNPIDSFVLAALEGRGWRPSPAADPPALLRRVYLDLIGLPPTLEQQAAFLRDTNDSVDRSGEDPLDSVVDELLRRPAYGERWARHWLDLVRYADSNGYETDGDKAYVWRYRDWVIRALNEDKPFDRFIVEQLAGDELPDASVDTLIATGYYRLGPWDQEPADAQEDRFDQLDDIVSTTSQVFLGLSIGCARCHNHKFEPLTMLDYYRLVAIFNTLRRPEKGSTGFDHAELDLPLGSPTELAALAERDRQIAALTKQIADAKAAFKPDGLPAEIRQQITDWERAQAALREATPDLPRGYFLYEPGPEPPPTHLLIRGKAARPGPEVAPGLPAVLVPHQPSFPPAGPRTSQRRLTLARWIASSDNPLTARVIVNRVWYYHFGEGLVPTLSEFGLSGDRPANQQLLDWLADWFVSEGWSLKKLHRLIIASNTYRMSKAWNVQYGAEDPEDRQLWRVPYRRLDVEAIRDSMLSVSGNLNPAMYGPAMYPLVPKEALSGHSDPEKVWPPFNEQQASRRTVYAYVKRSLIVPLIEVLDFCDPSRSAPRRMVTNVAPQALSLFNGEFVNRQAQQLAGRLVREVGPDPDEQIDRAYRLALCRPPTTAEKGDLTRFLRDEAARLLMDSAGTAQPLSPETARQRAMEQMCRTLFNLSEFVYAD